MLGHRYRAKLLVRLRQQQGECILQGWEFGVSFHPTTGEFISFWMRWKG